MKRAVLILVFLLLTVWTASPGLAAKKRAVDKLKYPELNPINMPKIHKTTTGNGIRLRLIKDDKLPLVSLNIMLKGGNAYEPATKIGLADITADLLRIGGTGDISGADLDKRLDTLGITVSFRAQEDYFQVSMECLLENFDEAVSLLVRT